MASSITLRQLAVSFARAAISALGETFADASILARKVIFGTRIRRLPLFKWLSTLLQVIDEPYLDWEDARTALEVEFPPAEVEKQLGIIVKWGRYAEILSYDDATRRISPEETSPAPA